MGRQFVSQLITIDSSLLRSLEDEGRDLLVVHWRISMMRKYGDGPVEYQASNQSIHNLLTVILERETNCPLIGGEVPRGGIWIYKSPD